MREVSIIFLFSLSSFERIRVQEKTRSFFSFRRRRHRLLLQPTLLKEHSFWQVS